MQSEKMEFYEVRYSGGHIVKDGAIQTYDTLREIFESPKYWLYLHHVGVNYLPLGASDSTEYLQFNAQYDVTSGLIYESISIDGNNVVTTNRRTFEVTENKVSAIHNRDKTSEVKYPSVKAMTSYTYSKEDVDAELSNRDERISELEEKNDALWKLSEGQVYDIVEEVEEGATTPPTGAKYMTVEDVRGKTEQESTRGYNIMPSAEKSTKIDVGVSVECDGKGTYTVKGTAYGNSTISLGLKETFTIPTSLGNGGSGCLYFNNEGTGLNFSSIDFYHDDNYIENWSFSSNNRVVTTYTNQQGKQVNRVAFRLNGGAGAIYDFTTKPMFTNDGSSSHTFEPFTNGESPNPEFPQEIVSVEEIHIKHTGKNLIGNIFHSKEIVSTSGVVNNTNVGCITDFIPLKTGETYTMSMLALVSNNKNRFYDKDKNYIGYDVNTGAMSGWTLNGGIGSTSTKTVTNPNIAYVRFQFDYTSSFVKGTENFCQFEKTSTPTPFEPYKEQTVSITPPLPLNKVGIYYDKVDVNSGQYEYVTHKFKPVGWTDRGYAVDGTKLFGIASPYSTGNVPTNYRNIVSNKVMYTGDVLTKNITGSYAGYGAIWCRIKDVSDATEFNALMADSEFVYLRANSNVLTPTTEPIAESDLDFLRSLENLPATDNIFITDQNGNDASFLVEYIRKLSEVVS